MIKVVVFDFDDTLYSNTNPLPWKNYCIRAVKHFLSKHDDISLSEILESIKDKGFSDRQLIDFLKSFGEKEEDIHNFFATHKPEGSTFDGCLVTSNQVLSDFAKRFKLFIVSNSLESSVRKNMSTLGIDSSYFENIISNSGESKEEVYKKIIKQQNIDSKQLFVIGNSYHSDILPALNIGADGRVVTRADFCVADFFDEENNVKTIKTFDGFMRGINFGLWLSQYRKFDISHFDKYNTENDVAFIKRFGYDHIRLPFDYELFNDEKIGFKYLDNFLSWCEKYDLNVIFDLHRMKGYSFDTLNENTLFENKNFQKSFISLWKKITLHYVNKGKGLCFELLNEVVIENGSQKWIDLYKKTVSEIRKIDRTRKILIGSNMYSSPQELKNLELLNDQNIIYTFHFYNPTLFTHQKASWNEYAGVKDSIDYPMSKEVYNNEMKKLGLVSTADCDIDIFYLERYIKQVENFAVKNDVICYCGEFGVINNAPTEAMFNWFKDVLSLFDKYNIGHAIWNYKEKQFQFQNFQTGEPNIQLFKLCAKF